MPPLYYEDVTIGDTAEPPMARTISESDVYTQAGLSGSYNPLHTDKEFMKTTEYERPLVQNTLLMTVMEGLTRRLPWEFATIAAYGRDTVRFTNPVFVDDTVHLTAEITEKRERSNRGGVITMHQQLFNQDGSLVVVGDYLLLLHRDPSDTT